MTDDHKTLESNHVKMTIITLKMKLQIIKDKLEREHCNLLNKQEYFIIYLLF
jgi:hypothetical protein